MQHLLDDPLAQSSAGGAGQPRGPAGLGRGLGPSAEVGGKEHEVVEVYRAVLSQVVGGFARPEGPSEENKVLEIHGSVAVEVRSKVLPADLDSQKDEEWDPQTESVPALHCGSPYDCGDGGDDPASGLLPASALMVQPFHNA